MVGGNIQVEDSCKCCSIEFKGLGPAQYCKHCSIFIRILRATYKSDLHNLKISITRRNNRIMELEEELENERKRDI